MTEFYTPETLKFFRGIKRHPNKEWYEKNKHVYKTSYYEASSRLIEALSRTTEFQALGLRGSGKEGIFRLHRDLRFSKDKSPYKSHNGYIMSRSGSKKDAGVFYMHVEPGASSLWMGYWLPEAKLLGRFRDWIAKHPDNYLEIESKLKARGLFFSTDEDLKKLPQAYRHIQDERLHPALKRRSHMVSEDVSDKELLDSPKLHKKIRDFARRSTPLMLWGAALEENL